MKTVQVQVLVHIPNRDLQHDLHLQGVLDMLRYVGLIDRAGSHEYPFPEYFTYEIPARSSWLGQQDRWKSFGIDAEVIPQ